MLKVDRSSLQNILLTLKEKIEATSPEKIPGLMTMLSRCIEYLEDPVLTHPISSIPYAERMSEFLDYCKGYQKHGEKWANILKSVPINNVKNVLEICPGWTSKVVLGLYYRQFSGKVTLICKSQESVKRLDILKKFLNIPFQIEVKNQSIYEKPSQQFDLVCGNHVLDDLLIDSLIGDSKQIHYLEEEKFKKQIDVCTKKIKDHPDHLNVFCNRLIDTLLSYSKKDGWILLSEYPNLYNQFQQLIEWEEILSNLRQTLIDTIANRDLNIKQLDTAIIFSK